MARTILGISLLLTAVAFAQGGAPTYRCDSRSPSYSRLKPEIREVPERLKASPFFKELTTRFGPLTSCSLQPQGGKTRLVYVFAKSARLVVVTDPAIEYSEQHVTFKPMSDESALALLKQAEIGTYGAKGCGIAWDQPKQSPGKRETLYAGDVCNCQARLTRGKKGVVALLLKSAC
ncbi:MAG: hypothetical protein ABI693_30555 [Bryobacteraceae bacterium]